MNSAISGGVTIRVQTFYQEAYSDPVAGSYMFAYQITIENSNPFPIQLLKRYWKIFDSNGLYREVEGEGVVGVQPVIASGHTYQYISGCHLQSEIGKMQGYYTVQNMENKKLFSVQVPPFSMVVPFKLN